MTNNVTLNDTLNINKTVNINLNNNNIKAPQKVFQIEGGSLNLTGTGKIFETNPYYGAIILKGSKNSTKKDYSTVSIGENITLEGWSGIFIDHNDNNTGYGILANIKGKINAVNDTDGGPGAGIYVNGNIKHEDNSPVINLTNTSKITSTGNGIYSAGYATYNINGAYISGEESALGIKSGVFNINDGTLLGTGNDNTPTTGNNNGINPSGTAIQIESNPNYKGNIELNIKNGLIQSNNSNVIYEYTVNNVETKVIDINLSGGTYKSNANKEVFSLSNSFKNSHPTFITGGTYSSNPSNYLKNGYSTTKNTNEEYKVITVFKEKETNNQIINKKKSNFLPIILITLIVSTPIILFLTKRKKFTNKK